MALDWYILDEDAHHRLRTGGARRFQSLRLTRAPATHTAMDEEAHQALMSRCGNRPLLRRVANYYEHAVYDPADVEQLLDELVSFGQHEVVDELVLLCREALHRRCGIVVIGD